jgi:hypothetical protein
MQRLEKSKHKKYTLGDGGMVRIYWLKTGCR